MTIKHITIIVLTILCSCSNIKKQAIETWRAEGVYYPVYIMATAPQCDTIVCCVDLPYLYNRLNVKCMSEQEFYHWVYEKEKTSQPLVFSTDFFHESLSAVLPDEKIDSVYANFGVEGLLMAYPLESFKDIPYTQIRYIGYLLWNHDICLRYDSEDQIWTMRR